MKNKTGQSHEVLSNVAKDIAAAEQERKELRFVYNLNNFEQGNIQVLKNNEFIAGFESYLLANLPENKEKITELLSCLGEGAVAKEISVRERALTLLSLATELQLGQNAKTNIILLAQVLCNWLEFEDEFLAGFSVLIKRVEIVLLWLIDKSCWDEVEELVVLLSRIKAGKLKKSGAIKSLTTKTLQKLEEKRVFDKLVDGYLLEKEQQTLIQNIFHSIGPITVRYLLDQANHSENSTEKYELLNLISSFGASAVPAIEDCLKNDPPWIVVKSIIYLISEIKIDAHYALVAKYFGHVDERLQHEMIRCVLKLGGPMMTARLIKGLGSVQDRLKIHILRLLVEKGGNDDDVLGAILDLARKRTDFSVESGNELQHAIIATLKTFPSALSITQLEKMRSIYSEQTGNEQLLLHIDEALMVLEPKFRHNQKGGGLLEMLFLLLTTPFSDNWPQKR